MPTPPRTQTGAPCRRTAFCSRIKLVSSPTRPPASCPFTRSAAWPLRAASRSSHSVASTTTLRPSSSSRTIASGEAKAKPASTTSQPSPAGTNFATRSKDGWSSAGIFNPNGRRVRPARVCSAAAGTGPISALTMPRQPARSAAITSSGAGSPAGVNATIRNGWLSILCTGALWR